MIGFDEFVFVTHDVSNSSDHRPRVHNALPSGDFRVGFRGAVIEPSHHFTSHDLSILLLHLEGDAENHEHMIHSRDAHGIDVREHVAARDSPLQIWILNQRVEEVCRRNEFCLV